MKTFARKHPNGAIVTVALVIAALVAGIGYAFAATSEPDDPNAPDGPARAMCADVRSAYHDAELDKEVAGYHPEFEMGYTTAVVDAMFSDVPPVKAFAQRADRLDPITGPPPGGYDAADEKEAALLDDMDDYCAQYGIGS